MEFADRLEAALTKRGFETSPFNGGLRAARQLPERECRLGAMSNRPGRSDNFGGH